MWCHDNAFTLPPDQPLSLVTSSIRLVLQLMCITLKGRQDSLCSQGIFRSFLHSWDALSRREVWLMPSGPAAQYMATLGRTALKTVLNCREDGLRRNWK